MSGKVYLVGAGPGNPELLTLKAARLLATADVVLHDSLVSREVLAMVSNRAELIDVGKRSGKKLLTQDELNSLLVSRAAKYQIVVRLKGGDPLLFGRAGEEISALRSADVDFEIVPVRTSAATAACVSPLFPSEAEGSGCTSLKAAPKCTSSAHLQKPPMSALPQPED